MSTSKGKVIDLYKRLIYLGRDYPLGFGYFRPRLHKAFMKNRGETDPEKIEKLLQHGEYIVKELEALYMLKKYRTLKRRYYNEDLTAQYNRNLENINSSGNL